MRRPDLVLRWAALLHDIGKPDTRKHEPDGGVSFHHHEVVGAKMARKRMRTLKYSEADDRRRLTAGLSASAVPRLRRGQWTDSAVRRYVTDAGPLLRRLHKLVRADCTTRNRRRAARLQANYDDLETADRGARREGGPAAGAARPRRQRDHGAARHTGRAAGRGGVAIPQGAADGARPAEQGRGHRRAAGVVERPAASPASNLGMEYCFGAGDGSATMWIGTPDTDLDGDGSLDALRLDFDGDGSVDDAIGDLDGDGLADHAALDLDDDGPRRATSPTTGRAPGR